MIPLPRRLLIWYVANALDDQEGRHKHVCTDVAMLDEIPDRDGQAKEADAVRSAEHQKEACAERAAETLKSMPSAGCSGQITFGGHPS